MVHARPVHEPQGEVLAAPRQSEFQSKAGGVAAGEPPIAAAGSLSDEVLPPSDIAEKEVADEEDVSACKKGPIET
jgi:hypothetical protein